MAQFTNQAQLSYNNSVTSSNIAVGEIIEVLSATKTAVIDTYSQNDNITYIISIINSGTVPLSGLTITDNLCPNHNHPHMIDLGLPSGTKWACCNVGAKSPEDYGGYYAWGRGGFYYQQCHNSFLCNTWSLCRNCH